MADLICHRCSILSRSSLTVLNRRTLLAGAAVAPAVGFAAPAVAETARPLATRPLNACILTPQAVEGPYYFDPKLQREDIAEGKPGVPLNLRFLVIEASDWRPIANARVDVWHAGADGLYSGYKGQGAEHATDTTGKTFLRGTQFANGEGEVRFRTVYPGWYEGRTTHIHFKVFLDEKNVLTGQMYFPDALSQYIYANVAAYGRDRPRDTYNSTDGIARMDKDRGGFCDIREEANNYLATLILGVNRTAKPLAEHMGAPPPPPPGARPSGPPPWGGPGFPNRDQQPVVIVPGIKG